MYIKNTLNTNKHDFFIKIYKYPKTQAKHIWAAGRGWEGMRGETGSGTREGLAQNDKEGGS